MGTKHLFVGKKILTAVFVFLFTVFGIQSSHAGYYYPSGIQQNVSEQTLRNNGWKLFYEETYGASLSNLTPFRPSEQYVILTGKAVGSSTLPVLAAAPTNDVFTQTAVNTTQLVNGTYWYNTQDTSIGFSPTNIISQQPADAIEAVGFFDATVSSPLRLSWHFNQGGWRLGDVIWLNASTAYLKQVWSWDGRPTAAPAYVRQTSNLLFEQSLYASDTLSDPDGQLRKTVDQIMNKYGSLIK